MLFFLLLINFASATYMHRWIFQVKNNVDLDYKKWQPEKLRNKIAIVEHMHMFHYFRDRADDDPSIQNLNEFTECMYREQIDYVSFEFLVYALSGLP